jgi:parallel beta-helix repeat protein
VFGVFLSTNSNQVLVDGNTVFNSLGGLALYDANSIVAHANTFYNCTESVYLANDAGNGTRDCTLQRNLCVNLTTSAPTLNTFTLGINYAGGSNILTSNALDYNYYWTPFVNAASIYVTPPAPATIYTVPQWQTLVGQDAHSWEEPLAYSAGMGVAQNAFVFFDYALGSTKVDILTNNYLDADGHAVLAGARNLAPYTSQVLAFSSSVPATVTPTVTPAAEALPRGNELLVYPNPVKGNAHLVFRIEKAGRIHMEAYNVAGRKLAALSEAFTQAGNAQIEWDCHGLPAGVYYCRAWLEGADGSDKAFSPFKVAVVR